MANKLEMEMDRTTGAGISTPVEMVTAETAYNRQEWYILNGKNLKQAAVLGSLAQGQGHPRIFPVVLGKFCCSP